MTVRTTHELRRLIERDEVRCVYCQRYVTWDPPADPSDPQQVGDWHYDGDYGCDASPETDEEGTGGHLTVEDMIALVSDRTVAVNIAIGLLQTQGYEAHDSGDALAVLEAALVL